MPANIAALNAEFLGRLRTFVRRRLQSEHDAEDVVQDVLMKWVQHNDSIDAQSVYAWLLTVTRRTILDRAKASRPPSANDADDSIAIDLGDDPSVSAELARCLDPMLDALSSADRIILQRIDLLDESQADIARELGMSISGMKSRVQRARRRLRAQLEDCCAIDRDPLGQPADYRRRPDRSCPNDGCGC